MIELDDKNKGGSRLRPDFFEKILEKTVQILELDQEYYVSVAIVDDMEIHKLNKQYRNKDKPTDVLAFAQDETDQSFPSFAPDGAHDLGEVIISFQTAQKQAESKGHGYTDEVMILFIHGVLHLLGYDHQTDEEEAEMKQFETKILREVSKK